MWRSDVRSKRKTTTWPRGKKSWWKSTGGVSTSSWRSTTCWTWQRSVNVRLRCFACLHCSPVYFYPRCWCSSLILPKSVLCLHLVYRSRGPQSHRRPATLLPLCLLLVTALPPLSPLCPQTHSGRGKIQTLPRTNSQTQKPLWPKWAASSTPRASPLLCLR